MKHTTTIVDNITNYKLVLMIVGFFCETYNSDLINVPAQIVSYMREIYYLMKNTLIVKQLKAHAIKSENATRNACIDHTPAEELRSQDGKSHITLK